MPAKDQFVVTPLTVVAQGSQLDVICYIQSPNDETKEHFIVVSLEDLKRQLRAKINVQSGDAQDFKDIAAVCNQPLDLSILPPTEKEVFDLDLFRLRRRQQLIRDGLLLAEDDTTKTLLASLIKSLEEHPEWVD